MATILSRQAFLAAKPQTEDVEVPEWGEDAVIRVRAASPRIRMLIYDAVHKNEVEHQAWLDDQAKQAGERLGTPRVALLDHTILSVMFTIVDEDGNCPYTIEDYDAFLDLDYVTIGRLYEARVRLEKPRESFADQKKTSAATRKGASSSGSRSRSAKR